MKYHIIITHQIELLLLVRILLATESHVSIVKLPLNASTAFVTILQQLPRPNPPSSFILQCL